MRVSDIQAWSNCETYALQSPPRPAGRANVAAWVGTLAHAYLCSEVKIDYPERLAFDALTPTSDQAIIQANAIAAEARRLLTVMGFGVIGREEEVRSDAMTGHLDIRAYHRDKGEAIIDLKTGQSTGTAWLQVGGYLDLYVNYAPMPTYAGVLHVPRQRIDRDQKGTLELREAKPVQQAWRQSARRIQDVLDGAPPTYSPGLHCGRCEIKSCPVRV